MSWQRWCTRVFLMGFLVLNGLGLGGTSLGAQAQFAKEPTLVRSDSPEVSPVAEIRETFADTGLVRVVVNVRPDPAVAQNILENRLDESPAKYVAAYETGRLPSLFTAAQNSFLAEANLTNKTSKLARFAPLVSLTLTDQAELEQLLTLSQKRGYRVSLDELYTPFLQETNEIINAPANWETGLTGSGAGQTVALLDTGVWKEHEFLRDKVLAEGCFSTSAELNARGEEFTSLCPNTRESQIGPGAASPERCREIPKCAHGTAVAGVVAGNNRFVESADADLTHPTFQGVAKDAKLLSVQVFSQRTAPNCGQFPACLQAFKSDVLDGLGFVRFVHLLQDRREASDRVSVVNLSFGGSGIIFNGECDGSEPELYAAVQALHDLDVATVIPVSSNGRYGVQRPACLSNVVTVGQTNAADTIVSDQHPTVELYAPGTQILTSHFPKGEAYPELYRLHSGTSISAGAVAGALAILEARFPDLTVPEKVRLLQETGVPVTYRYGFDTLPGRRLQVCKHYLRVNSTWTCGTNYLLFPEPERALPRGVGVPRPILPTL